MVTPDTQLMPGPHPQAPPPSEERLLARLRARFVQWRRGRAARGRRGPSGLVLGLIASLLLRLVAFGASLSYLFSEPSGQQVGTDAVERLAVGSRVVSATFLDEDDQVVLEINSVGEAQVRQLLKARAVTPLPACSFSSTTWTVAPRRAKWKASEAPTTPAPTIMTRIFADAMAEALV